MALTRYTKIPYMKPILSARLPGTSVLNAKIASKIIYDEGDPLAFGLLIITESTEYTLGPGHRSKLPPIGSHKYQYSITTGNLIEKDGKKYYEVYPELYDYKQARILSAAFKMIKESDAIPSGKDSNKSDVSSFVLSKLHPFHAARLQQQRTKQG